MPKTIPEQIRLALASSRWEADRIVDFGERTAQALEPRLDEEAAAAARARLDQVRELRESIESHSRAIESAYAGMAEALASTSQRLLQISREARFEPPAWPGGLDRAVELKMSETRALTLRFTPSGGRT